MKRFSILSQLWLPFKNNGISIYAAGASFYLILSIFPAVAFVFSVLPCFHIQEAFLWQILTTILPASFHTLLDHLLAEIYSGHSHRVLSLSVFAVLWSASKGILAIMDGLNATLSQTSLHGFVRRKILAMIYFIIFLLCILLMLICLVFGRFFLVLLKSIFPNPAEALIMIFRFRSISALLLLSTIFSLMYRFLPSEKLPYKFCIHSGILSALGWIIISCLFSFYVEYVSGFNRLYGNISILLLVGIWLNLCVSLLLYSGLYGKIRYTSNYQPLRILIRFVKGEE